MGRVTFDVGGGLFETSYVTLTNRPSNVLQAIVEQGHEERVHFIDRDPTHFRHILNYLRGTPSFPGTPGQIEELCAEADFYCLTELVELTQQRLVTARRESVAHQLSLLCAKLAG